jgi:hypothetical protein
MISEKQKQTGKTKLQSNNKLLKIRSKEFTTSTKRRNIAECFKYFKAES